MFFHTDTERELLNLRAYLNARRRSRSEDCIDRWIRMVATNRLTGHSPGFFSVYTLPPNQAVSAEGQVQDQPASRAEAAVSQRARADPEEVGAAPERPHRRGPRAAAPRGRACALPRRRRGRDARDRATTACSSP